MFAARKDYDLVLFGVTGFTGRLAAEHLTKAEPNLRWAACARNEAKAKKVLEEVKATPSIEIADLICENDEQETKLRTGNETNNMIKTRPGTQIITRTKLRTETKTKTINKLIT